MSKYGNAVNMPKPAPGPWAELANCIGLETDLFFPGKHDGGVITTGARLVCASCVVRSDCLAYAMESPMERHGVWGGTSFRERERLRRAGAA